MGMRVGGSSGSWANQQNSAVGNWQQKQQGVKDLFSMLKAGDLQGAQKAMASIQGNSSASSANSPFAAIAQALQSGDMQGAQSAAQSMHARHQGHHHAPVQSASANAVSPLAANTGVGTNINLSV